ncbi:hypothetical protein [uncultured Paenibacillus sp.]|uniref:hypothetical protein n=1 Tax=uncultured Paenibacillus sp. TaxID=227322 RepID=UPI0015A97D61|nr:hypothetical protein [uncultured Paenibacillus sp.]
MEPSIDKELERLERELREPLRQALQPGPTPSETAALIEALQPEFAALQAQNAAASLEFNAEIEPPSLGRLLRSQFRLNRRSLMLTGAAVFLMLVFLVDPERPFNNWLLGDRMPGLFSLITPLMLIASMLYSYRTWDRGMRAIESVTPYPPALVIYSRMLMVMALVVGWALISSVVVSIRVATAGEAALPFIPFLLEWLGISLLTGGAAMYALFRYGHMTGVLSAGGVYVLWLVLIDQTSALSLNTGTGPATAMNAGFLLVGVLLLFRSYIRSRNLQTGSVQFGARS